MDDTILNMLGLFTVPPEAKIKDREECRLENQLLSAHKDFFNASTEEAVNEDNKDDDGLFVDQKDTKKQKDLERQAQRRERHLQQMDATKKMYIDSILQRNLMCTGVDYYWEVIACEKGDASDEFTKEDVERRRQENERKFKQQKDLTYFDKLTEVIELRYDPEDEGGGISLFKVERFPLLISNVDVILRTFIAQSKPILELCLNSTFLTASECLVLAENPQFEHLRSLDLSCNPITAKGLLYLVHPNHSRFSEKLQSLTLFNCEIDHSQTYLISNDQLQNGKCQFNLKHLNLSHNNLGTFLNYIVEFDLINADLKTLILVNCQLTDENLISLASANSGQKISSLEVFDISNNYLGPAFNLLLRQIRETCDFLQTLICAGNPGVRQTSTLQVAKSKKPSESLNMLLRLDLSHCLKGDEQVAQLAQSSYLKDLKWLNLQKCKFGTDGFNELVCSKNLRSLEVLIVRGNKIGKVEGPFSDLEEASEKQIKKGIMKLQLLDIRSNRLTKIFLKEAVTFLKDAVVLMWDNPFESDDGEMEIEFYDPASLFRSGQLDDDYHLIQNPMHIFTRPLDRMVQRKTGKLGAKGREHVMEEIAKRCGFIYDDI